MDDWADWADFYRRGGPFMHWIALVAAIGGVVVLERAWQLRVRCYADARRMLAAVGRHLLAGETALALQACTRRDSVVGHVVRAGLMAGIDRWRTETAVRQAQMEVTPRITRRIGTLRALASLAMLVGFVGTVFGMIAEFRNVATVSSEARAERLALDLAQAIHTSGFGIAVGTALLAAHLWLRTLADRLLAEVALCGARVVGLVALRTEPPVATSGPPYR